MKETQNGIAYYKPIVRDSIVYSIDKVRISFQLICSVSLQLRNEPDSIQNFFDYIQLKSDEETLYRKIVFERIYTHQRNKLCIHVAIFFSDNSTGKGFIEFNPNKVFQSPKAIYEIQNFLNACESVSIDRYDLAIDIPCEMSSIFPRKGRKKMMLFISSPNNYTVYWGERNKVGFAKLYDKSEQCRLSSSITRLEITLGNPEGTTWEHELMNAIPPVYIPADIITNDSEPKLSSPEKVILILSHLLMKNEIDRILLFNILGKLKDKNRRNVIQNLLLSGYKQFSPDIQMISQVTAQFVNDIRGQNIKSA